MLADFNDEVNFQAVWTRAVVYFMLQKRHRNQNVAVRRNITVHLQAKSPQTLFCACMSSDSADMS